MSWQLRAHAARAFLFSSKETLFSPLDLFPVKHQTGEAASGQQGGAGSGQGEAGEAVLWQDFFRMHSRERR